MKGQVKRKGMKLWILLFACMLCVVGFSGNTFYSKATQNEAATKETQFDIQATVGFNNMACVGRNMLANVTVTNNGADFNGRIQILIPITEGNNVMYENSISVAAGETKHISMPMYVNSYTGKLVVNLTDDKENIVAKKRIKVSFITQEDDSQIVAILTENKDVLGYWEEENKKAVYISQKDMPEQEEGLEPLDFIIIDNFDTQTLNKKQYEALKDWVNKGGNLVIGTGVNVSRTLGVFADDFITGSFGAPSKDGTVDFKVEGASLFEDEKNGICMQQVKKNLGAVFIFSTDLGVDYASWKKEGAAFQTMVYSHKVSGGNKNNSNRYYYDQEYGLNITDKGNLPSLKKYAVVLFIYIVVVSWVLYFVLRKKDKLEWTWGLIPAFALIFALIIYGMGSATRITEPFITYARIIEWTGEGGGTTKGTTRMAITSPYNEKYTVAVPKGVTAYASMSGDGNYYYEEDTDFNDYKIGFRQNGDQQMITFHNLGAFETGLIETNDVASVKGSYEADVTCDNYDFSGTFTNNTGKEIRNAVFLSDGRAYQLGDIKDGETVKISDKCKNVISLNQEEYRMMLFSADKQIASVFGVSDNSGDSLNLEETRYMNAVGDYISKSGTSVFMQGKVIGCMDSSIQNDEMTQSWGMDCSGVTVGVFPVDVNYTNSSGQTFVPDLFSCNISSEERERYLYDEEIKVEYTLKSNETLTGLYYLVAANNEYSPKEKQGKVVFYNASEFEGTIKAYNFEKKVYEEIFADGKAGEIKDVKRFVGNENKVVLKIATKDDNTDYAIPVISATKEVK